MSVPAAVPTAYELLGMFRLEHGSRWGDVATPVQKQDAEAVLDVTSGVRYHFITRARGYSKTTDLAGCAVAALLSQAPRGSRSYAIAADRDQAALLVDAARGFIMRLPALAELLQVDNWRITNRRSGATLEAIAADVSGTWGLRPYLAFCDELSQWGTSGTAERIWDAMASAMPKTGGRLTALMTAGDPGHWSARVRDHAATHPLWRLSETPGPPPWIPEDLLEEQRSRLLPSMYQRLFLNEWVSGEDSLVSEDDLAACVVLDGPLPARRDTGYVVAVDLGIKNDRTVVVVAHGEPILKPIDALGTEVTTGVRVVCDRIEVWQGTREHPVALTDVEEWVEQAARAYNGAQVHVDPWQAVGLCQRLAARGIRIREFTFSQQSVGRLAALLHRLLRDRLMLLPDDADLIDELRNVRLRETAPGVVRLDHTSSGHDDRAVALALASYQIVEGRSGPPPAASSGRVEHWQLPEGGLAAYAAEPERLGLMGLAQGMRL